MTFLFYYSKADDKGVIEIDGVLHTHKHVTITAFIQSVYREDLQPRFVMAGNAKPVTIDKKADRILVT